MSDLISRKAVLKHIEKIRQGVQMMDDIRRASIIMNGMDLCEEAVRNQPSAQSERKKGKWIKVNGKTAINCSSCYHCSWSRSFEDTVKRFNFCPNCGADMR